MNVVPWDHPQVGEAQLIKRKEITLESPDNRLCENDFKEIVNVWDRKSRIIAVYIWTNDNAFTICVISMYLHVVC